MMMNDDDTWGKTAHVDSERSASIDLHQLTLTLAKDLESFVGGWILGRIEQKLDMNQFGALRGRSTSHALVAILHNWCCALDAGGSVRALFVDFSKAFDRVDHTLLLTKLRALGIPDSLVKWVFSFIIDDLQLTCSVHKFVDDTTITEILPDNAHTSSQMGRFGLDLEQWSVKNYMIVNYKKLKNLLLAGSETSKCRPYPSAGT